MSVAPPTEPASPGDAAPDPAALFARVAFDHAPDAILLCDDGRHCVAANPAACALLGYTRGQLLALRVDDLVHPDDRPWVGATWAGFVGNGAHAGEWRLVTSDGDIRLVDARAVAGVLPGVHLAALRDITPRRADDPPAAPARRGTVLLVEDEETVRDFVRVVLDQSGYAVVTAADAEEGAAAFAADPGRFDLVFSDVLMPGRSGPEMVRELRRTRPDLRVLYMSGFVGGAAAGGGSVPPGAAVLEKPFGIDALLAAVARAAAAG